MKRLAISCTVACGLLLAVGLGDFVTNYNWAQGDQNPLFGNPHILLNDGATVLIAAGLLAVGTAIMWVKVLRKGRRAGGAQGQHGDQCSS
jgi:hypothetical protein